MTYAQDVTSMRDRDRRRGLKRIDRHTDEELDDAVEKARRRLGEDFWTLLHGVDAYQERRRRRDESRRARRDMRLKHDLEDANWGDD